MAKIMLHHKRVQQEKAVDSQGEVKLCINCKKYIPPTGKFEYFMRMTFLKYDPSISRLPRCAESMQHMVDPVNGKVTNTYRTCENMRMTEFTGCGARARFFEPKEIDNDEARTDSK